VAADHADFTYHRRMRTLMLVSVACVLAMTTPVSADATWIVLKIRRVEVAANRADGTPWDLATERGPSGCHALGAPGVATSLCVAPASSQPRRDPRAPDLLVEIGFGDTKFRTPVAPNTLNEAFDFPIAVPLDAVPVAGVAIRVLDLDDDVDAGELVGTVRVTKQQLRDSLTGSPLLSLADGRVQKLHVEVRRYEEPSAVPAFRFAANQNPVATSTHARAGELITITARGTYSVRSAKEQLDPDGYSGGANSTFNRTELAKANHGGALAYIGPPDDLHASLFVGSCVFAIAPVPGQIHVGVNDTDIRNNRGTLEFVMKVTLPTLDQWRMGGSSSCASTKPDARSPLTHEMVLAQIQTVYLASIRLCYKDHLRKDPYARGKVTLSLTINETGRTTKGDARGFASDVDACITPLMASWRFPIPRDGEGQPTTASYAVSMLLQP
jgi:hypothetical protein